VCLSFPSCFNNNPLDVTGPLAEVLTAYIQPYALHLFPISYTNHLTYLPDQTSSSIMFDRKSPKYPADSRFPPQDRLPFRRFTAQAIPRRVHAHHQRHSYRKERSLYKGSSRCRCGVGGDEGMSGIWSMLISRLLRSMKFTLEISHLIIVLRK
jgi:hypothetical protein